ncbi:hypothetical protein AMECASPLE_034478 [Ameca splendens]|uniref:Uncharacterized protein n=1 Tax=Ameca splendens TaxID=208324 RepID=A0ABV0XK89_9TELE
MVVGGTYALATVPQTNCDTTQIMACTLVPGGTVYIRLMKNATGFMLMLNKNLPFKNLTVLVVKKGQVKIREEYRNRAEFVISTGTLMIADVKEDDAARYTLEVYISREILVRIRSFTLLMKERRVSIGISISVPGFLLVILVCFVFWKLKPSRTSGYEMVN